MEASAGAGGQKKVPTTARARRAWRRSLGRGAHAHPRPLWKGACSGLGLAHPPPGARHPPACAEGPGWERRPVGSEARNRKQTLRPRTPRSEKGEYPGVSGPGGAHSQSPGSVRGASLEVRAGTVCSLLPPAYTPGTNAHSDRQQRARQASGEGVPLSRGGQGPGTLGV